MSDHVLPELFTRQAGGAVDIVAPVQVAAREGRLVVQQCAECGSFQSPPEHLCHACLSEELAFVDHAPQGVVFSWARVWHPVDDALAAACPYVVLLVSLPDAGNVRVIGNLVGDPDQPIVIGSAVNAVFEHHEGYSLVQWALA
ncbi:Zn-ribbon domain-containing OB-fold protein [Pseudonocardia xishanensis]|uniref:Zn-ribbon domain-containing OB-fold protein n=1 Tax=Pseudonocardia xishanensis TaxID=630995 RepID=UPI0031E5C0A7